MRSYRKLIGALGVLTAAAFPCVSTAQSCDPTWLPSFGSPGLELLSTSQSSPSPTGTVTQWWDPDGDGPRGHVLVIGGTFDLVGDIPAKYIIAWDPATGEFSTLGAGRTGPVRAMAVLQTGELVVGQTGYVFKWDGSVWTNLGAVNGTVSTMLVMPNGDLMVGGQFGSIGGVASSCLARWNAQGWSAMDPMSIGVTDLAVAPNGDLIASGPFLTAAGVPAFHIARWNGIVWRPLGTYGLDSTCNDVVVRSNGDVVAIDRPAETPAGVSLSRVRLWNGTQWISLGEFEGGISEMITLASGEILVVGGFTALDGVPMRGMAIWNGSSWRSIEGDGNVEGGYIASISELGDGEYLAVGNFASVGGEPSRGLAIYRDQRWQPMFKGNIGEVYALHAMQDGRIIAGGLFSAIGGVFADNIAEWDGVEWRPMGDGFDSYVLSINSTADGEIIAGGFFEMSGTVPILGVARWDGSDWQPMGDGVSMNVYEVHIRPDGTILVGGEPDGASAVWQWDGAQWQPLASVSTQTSSGRGVYAMTESPDGRLVAGGVFSSPARIAAWDGTAWTQLGDGFNASVFSFVRSSNGTMFAGGEFSRSTANPFTTHRALARWDGTRWNATADFGQTGFTPIYALAARGNGDIIWGGLIGQIPGPLTVNNIGGWDGTNSYALGTGTNYYVEALAMAPGDELFVGGQFTTAGGAGAVGLARYVWNLSPRVAFAPQSQVIYEGATAQLTTIPVTGYPNVALQWTRDGQPVVDGATTSGSTISGSSFAFASPTNGEQATLSIENATPSDSGAYQVVLSNLCGTTTVDVDLRVCPACPADYDADGGTTAADLAMFLTEWEQGHPCADTDRDGGITGADLAVFISAYELGGC